MVQPYSITDMFSTWKNSYFTLSENLDFHMVDKYSIIIYTLPRHIWTSLSVDEILLPSYINWSTIFRGLPFNEMAQSWFKHMNSVLSDFIKRPMVLAACSRLCSRDLAWTGIFLWGGVRGVMVIVVGNRHSDMSSIPGRDWLHFTLH